MGFLFDTSPRRKEMGRLFDFAKFKANIILLFRFGVSFFQPKAFFMWIVYRTMYVRFHPLNLSPA